MSKTHEYRYVDHDFRPAPPGWRVLFLVEPDAFNEHPMAGWLVQIRTRFDVFTDEPADDVPLGERPRRVVPAIHSAWGWDSPEIGAVDSDFLADALGAVWRVVAPGEELPTLAEAVAELDDRRRFREEQARRQARREAGVSDV